MNRIFYEKLAVMTFVFSLVICGTVYSEDNESSQGVKKYGVVHNIAEDRQVVKIGGVYEPEGLDFYMKRQFDRIMTELEKIQNKLSKLEDEVKAMRSGGAKT